MKKIEKVLALTSLLALFSLFFISPAQATSKTTIKLATDSDTKPFTYKDGDKFAGYDIDVAKAIFKGSKKYKLSFETVAFSSILTGLDADRYQLSANNFNYSEERSEKYLFSDPISKSNYAVAATKGQSYQSLADLSGKSIEVYTGSNYASLLENWNKEHADIEPIDIKYVANSVTLTQRLQHIEDGKIDFLLYDAISLETVIKDQNFDLQVTDISEKVGDSRDGLEYIIFPKSKEGKALRKFVNKRIKALKEDGTLKKLSEKHFGGDYVSSLE